MFTRCCKCDKLRLNSNIVAYTDYKNKPVCRECWDRREKAALAKLAIQQMLVRRSYYKKWGRKRI